MLGANCSVASQATRYASSAALIDSAKSDFRSCIAWASFASAAFMSMPNLRPFRIVVSALYVRSMNRFSTTFADSTRSRALLTTSIAWSNSPWRICSFAGLERELAFLEELLELGGIGTDLVRRLQEPLSSVPDLLGLLEEDPQVRDRVGGTDRGVERLHVIAVAVHPAGIGHERGDRDGALADRPELSLDGLDGLFRHALLKADAFRLLLALLGGRDCLAVLLRPEELARALVQSLRGSGVSPVHSGPLESLFEAPHPHGDSAVAFLRRLGLRLRGVVERLVELSHLVCAVRTFEQAGRRRQGEVHRVRVGHHLPEPAQGRRGLVPLTLQDVELLPQSEREVRRLFEFARVEVLARLDDRVARLREVHALHGAEDRLCRGQR